MSTLALLGASFAQAADLTGTWRSIDDKSGFSKAIIAISKDSNGVYQGKIVKLIPRPGYNPKRNLSELPCTIHQ